MEGIDIKIYNVGSLKDVALIKISGFVDTATSPELQKVLTQTMEKGFCQFVIDMADVQYVSSAGWGVFVGEIRGLREKSGDLKITQMIPEVYEVFEMLEFDRILMNYDSNEEAIDDFDFERAIDYKVIPEGQQVYKPESAELPKEQKKVKDFSENLDFSLKPSSGKSRNVNEVELPLPEKVKKLVVENPRSGAFALKRQLYSPRFGYTKIGIFKIRALLKKLGLETKAKRFRYFRSR